MLDNDNGIGDRPISLSIESEPDHGKAETLDGEVRYSPDEEFLGEITFSYLVRDSNNDTSGAIVTVTVTPVEMEQ